MQNAAKLCSEAKSMNEQLTISGIFASMTCAFVYYHFSKITSNQDEFLTKFSSMSTDVALLTERLKNLSDIKDELLTELKSLKDIRADVEFLKKQTEASFRRIDEIKKSNRLARDRIHEIASSLSAVLISMKLNPIKFKDSENAD